MTRHFLSSLTLSAGLLFAPISFAAPVTDEGWAEKSADLEFYIEVPMIDNKEIKDYGVGRNITAESIINSVRYAGNHPNIHHVVFKMDTGGGALHHAEAMEDIIEEHHENTEFHIVVQHAISAGIWTAFSCDSIFMCESGTIGGATAYYQLGNVSVVADDIPEIAGRLEITAKRNGYPTELIKPLMFMKSELHAWTDENGEKQLSNTAPEDKSKVKDYDFMDQDNTVLTLTAMDAVDIGIAKHIDAFDTSLVGNKIGVQNWTLANRYGKVIDEIGWIYNTTRVMEDYWVEQQLALPQFPVVQGNRNHPVIKRMMQDRREHADIVEALRMINEALNELPDIHPERHLYVAGPDGQTILEDPKQWAEDVKKSRALAGTLSSGFTQLVKSMERVGIDNSNLEELEGPIATISRRINMIAKNGNVAYWQKEKD